MTYQSTGGGDPWRQAPPAFPGAERSEPADDQTDEQPDDRTDATDQTDATDATDRTDATERTDEQPDDRTDATDQTDEQPDDQTDATDQTEVAGSDATGEPGATAADEPADAGTGADEPAAAPAGSARRPGERAEVPIEIWSPEEVEAFRGRFAEVIPLFVDDPAEAVAQGAAVVRDAVEAVTTALQRQVPSLDPDGGDADTEALRLALRGYRSFLERLLAL